MDRAAGIARVMTVECIERGGLAAGWMPVALVGFDHAQRQLAVWDPAAECLIEGRYRVFPVGRSRTREQRGRYDASLGDVPYHLDHAGSAILHAECAARGDLSSKRNAVRVQCGGECAKRIRLGGPDESIDIVAAAGREQRAEREPEDFFGDASEHLAGALVPGPDRAVEADEHQRVAAAGRDFAGCGYRQRGHGCFRLVAVHGGPWRSRPLRSDPTERDSPILWEVRAIRDKSFELSSRMPRA